MKDLTAARLKRARHSWGSTAASQVTTLSMVAMLGWIMPLPLAMPPTLTALPPISTCAAPATSPASLARPALTQLLQRRTPPPCA